MVVFTHFDTKTFEECLRYIQDSLDWVVDHNSNSQYVQPVISQDKLIQAANTLSSLSHLARRSHNHMALVNRLPPEILSQIFLYIQGDFPQVSFSPDLPPRSDPSLSQFNLVCRHWRWVLTSNPAFWTDIYLSSSTIAASAHGVSLKLSRSRTMPLTVYIDRTLEPRHIAEVQGLQALLRAHRIQDLRSYNPSSKVLSSFLKRADKLKVVVIIGDQSYRDAEELRRCTLPQLEVLSAYRTSIWQEWRTSNLRYLSLSSQTWRSDSVEGMLELFRTNPHLEELMLARILVLDFDWDNVNLAAERYLPLALPRLHRMLVQENPSQRGFASCPVSKIVLRITVPGICARRFDLSGTHPFNSLSGERNNFPATRIHLNDDAAVGTDDIFSWAIKDSWGLHSGFPISNINPAEVEELWLADNLFCDDVFLDYLLAMHNVTKLVITQYFTHWAGTISECFYRLEELQLHTQANKDGRYIIGFLHSKEYRRQGLKTLRFVREPNGYSNEAFFPWKKGYWKFARHVGRVEFEERHNDGKDPEHLEFTLPEVCNTPSPVHSDWRPWKQDLLR